MCCAWMPKIHKYGKYNGSFVTTRRSPKSNKCSVEESNLTQVASAMQTKVQTTVAMPVSTAYGTTTSRTTEDAFNILQSIKSVFNRPGFFHPIYISFLSTSYLKIITAEKKKRKEKHATSAAAQLLPVRSCINGTRCNREPGYTSAKIVTRAGRHMPLPVVLAHHVVRSIKSQLCSRNRKRTTIQMQTYSDSRNTLLCFCCATSVLPA